jgi:hypothetical protein
MAIEVETDELWIVPCAVLVEREPAVTPFAVW